MSKEPPPNQQATSAARIPCHKPSLPSKDDLTTLFANAPGPVKDAKSAKAYLESKAWFLREEQLCLAKFSRILFTALLIKGIPPEAQTVIKAVAFAIEDAASNLYVNSIVSKVSISLSHALTPNSDLLAAIAKDYADTLIKTKDAAQLSSENLHKLSSLGIRKTCNYLSALNCLKLS
jgi:hypothetical protein